MKKLFFLFLMLLLPMMASADAVEIDGIYYNLVFKAKQAEVTQMPNDGKYAGNVVIPEKVSYEGSDYSVTSIGIQAFFKCSGLIFVTIGNSVTRIGEKSPRLSKILFGGSESSPRRQ